MKNWQDNLYSDYYDYEYILNLKQELINSRENEDYQAIIHLIRSNAVRNLVFFFLIFSFNI